MQSASSQRTVTGDVDRMEVARPVQSSACLHNCNREMTHKKRFEKYRSLFREYCNLVSELLACDREKFSTLLV